MFRHLQIIVIFRFVPFADYDLFKFFKNDEEKTKNEHF